MISRIQLSGSCLITLTLLLFAGSAVAQDISPRCEAAVDRAVGDYSRCLLLADAHFARRGNVTTLEDRKARCVTRFDRRTRRARSRYGAEQCASPDLVVSLADRTVSYAEDVSREAGGFDDPPVQSSCDKYPIVGRQVFSGIQEQILFGDDPPMQVPQSYTFSDQLGASGELVRANIYSPSLAATSFSVICGYSPKVVPEALPQLICVEKKYEGTRNVYVTKWDEDCVAQEIEVIGYEPGRFVGRMTLTRVGEW